MLNNDYQSLVDVLLASRNEENKGITFIEGNNDIFISYKDLYNNSLKSLYYLQSKNIKPGDELILQIENNQDFIQTYWACLLGGIIPVPLTLADVDENRLKLLKVWELLNNPYLITSNRLLSNLNNYLNEKEKYETMELINNRALLLEDYQLNDNLGEIYESNSDDIAFIQFSSGSTGDPKGVILTHENLITNINAIIFNSKASSLDSTISWLPLTHDMGIIGFHLTPLMLGINQYIMPSSLFVTRPMIWIDKVNHYRITILSSPNFGYSHFLKYYESSEERKWDLSCIRLIFNGAEPISANLVNLFFQIMSNWGLKKSSMFPVYGLAEASLAVTFPPVEEELVSVKIDRNSLKIGENIRIINCNEKRNEKEIAFVDLGFPVKDVSVRINDGENMELSENIVGYIQIKGKSITKGYYNNEVATSNVITKDGWLNTGDLGFIRKGRLIVTGRVKDLIISNGQNLYPHDLERLAAEYEGIELGKVIVSGVYNNNLQSENIAVFVLFRGKIEKFIPIVINLKRHLKKLIGIDVNYIIPVRRIPKTTSGKLQRFILKEQYENGDFSQVLEQIDDIINSNKEKDNICENEIEKKLLSILTEELQINNISINDNIIDIGGDSLKATYIAARIHENFNIRIPLNELFSTKTIKEIAEYIATTSKNTFSQIEKVTKKEYYETSSAQKRIFTLTQINQNDINYNISQVIQINGKLDIEQLRVAFMNLVSRHESLRTSFEIVDGEVMQKIHENIEFDLNCLELTEEDIDHTIREFIKPFNLIELPLLRVGIISLEEEKHLLIFDVHHIISDGSSLVILIDELIELYEGNELQNLKNQYKDFSAWQNKTFLLDSLKSQEMFWLNEFDDEIPVLNLPTDYERPNYQSFEGDTYFFNMDKYLTERLTDFSKGKNVSLFMTLLAAYYILIAKYSGQEDIVIGIPIAGRNHPDIHKVIGMFVNTLALRNYPLGTKSFEDFLNEVKDKSINAYENQDYQFEMLIEKLNIKRDMSRNPLFDVMFVFQNMLSIKPYKKQFEFKQYQFNNKVSKFDLTLFATETEDGLRFEFEYATKLFSMETIKRMSDQYLKILSEIIENPSIKILNINLLIEKEQNILEKFNDTFNDYPADKTINELFEEQVEKTPDNVAVVYEDKQLTYKELNERANQLARVLRDKGVKADTIVGIMVERSLEMIVGIMGVLKAGGTYLPIDSEYPEDRIEFMLEDSKTNILLTQSYLTERITFRGEIINLQDNEIYKGNAMNLTAINRPENLAYVIYTSGSTGRPKGVMIQQKNLVNYIYWANKNYVGNEDIDFPLYTSISFDLTISSIYIPLISGNKIFIYKQTEEMLLEKILKEDKVNIIKLTPAHLKLIKDQDNNHRKVKRLIVGGEQLTTKLARDIYKSFNGKIEIFNEYGPTETTVGCMIYKYDVESDSNYSVPIGKPIDNIKIHLLDNYLMPVPINVIGEIYISGNGLAKGYLNKPGLTAEKFVDNLFNSEERMYKTGDLAKLLPNGNIEYIGRVDHQVKIKGYRIELGEIEAQLLNHKLIQEVKVIVKENEERDKYLVGYIVAKNNTNLSPIELREFLLMKIPDYMIPLYFINVDYIPLTKNGKIDIEALPEVNKTLNIDDDYKEPISDIEKIFSKIWTSVLGIEKIGININFFTLGGDSIKAIQIVSRLKKEGINVSVKDILTYQTISSIISNSNLIENGNVYEQGILEGSFSLPPIYNWFFSQEFNNPNHYNQSILLKLKKKLDNRILEEAFNKLIKLHDGLRINYNAEKMELYYNNDHLNNAFTIEQNDISNLSSETQNKEIEKIGFTLKSSFDITKSLLIKAATIILSENEKLLLITSHHLVIDGVSWRILLEDLSYIYNLIEKKEPIQVPSKTAPIKTWYKINLDYYNNFISSEHIEFWPKIDNYSEVLPRDYEVDDWNIENRITLKSRLNKEETLLLKSSNKTYNTNLIDLLLTALVRTVKGWINNSEVLIELENHGRLHGDTDFSRTVGWFTSLFPFKLKLSSERIGDQIKEIKEQLRSIPENGISYGILNYRTLNKRGMFPGIRFNYLGEFGREINNDLFAYSEKETGNDVSLINQMTVNIEINAMILNDNFILELSYNQHAYNSKTIYKLINNYLNNLREIITHINNEKDIHFTPSDFETVDIKQEDLDELFG